MKVLLILEENYWKTEIKLIPLCAISHENSLRYFVSYYRLQSGFYPSTFLKLVNGSKNSILSFETQFLHFSVSTFYVCLSGKTLDRFFILLHQYFYSCKPQIRTKQTGLTIWFVIPWKNLCRCVQKNKNKHDDGADVAFFVPACFTHSLVERLAALTVLLTNKDKSPGNEEA